MSDYIAAPAIGEILRDEFMIPMDLSSSHLAKEIHVPVSTIQTILNNGHKITPDTSPRLARYFGVLDRYYLNIQADLDARKMNRHIPGGINEDSEIAVGKPGI